MRATRRLIRGAALGYGPRMARDWFGARLVGVLVVVAVLAAVWWLASPSAGPTGPTAASRPPAVPTKVPPVAARPPAPRQADEPRAPAVASAPAPDTSPEADPGDLAQGWAAVNMDEVRKAMPDNLYWKMSVPTKDPDILKWREDERARWNVEYGKVLSGNASEDDIRAYYDQRAQLAGDYIEFGTYLLDHYSDTLPERDISLVQLAVKLNRARLEEIPRKIEEAMTRKQQQDAARAQWLADQAAFGGDGAAPDPNAQ